MLDSAQCTHATIPPPPPPPPPPPSHPPGADGARCRLLQVGDVFAIRKRFHNSQQALAHSLYSKDSAVVGCQHDFIFFRVDKLEPKLPTSCAVEFGTCDVNMEVSACD